MKFLNVIGLCLLMAASATAQEERERDNVFRRAEIAYVPLSIAFEDGSTIYGGHLALTLNPQRSLGFVSDLSAQSVALYNGAIGEAWSYRFGPKFSVRHGDSLTLFTQFLAGGVRNRGTMKLRDGSSISTPYANGLSLHAGVGADIGIRPWIAARFFSGVNRETIRGYSGNQFEAGMGPVFRFGR